MSTVLNNELNSLIANFAKNSVSQPGANDPFSPAEGGTTEPVVPAPVTPEPSNVTPPVAPVAATPAPTTPQKTDAELFEDWDTVSTPPAPAATEPTTPTTPSFDFSTLAKELELGELKEKDEVVKVVKELKEKAEALKTVPEDLAKAMEIAKAGGNYLEYLQVSVVDWAKEDPIVLYENYVEDQFYDATTGLVDYDKVDKVLEKMDDEEKEFRGKELQKQYVAYQKQQKDFIQQQAIAKKAQFENSVKQVVNELKDVNGYVLTPSKKAELLEYVLSGQDLSDNDVRSRVVNAFIKKNFQHIDQYMKTKVRNATQRELLQEAQMPDIKPSTTPTPGTPTKQYSVSDYIAELAKQKGF